MKRLVLLSALFLYSSFGFATLIQNDTHTSAADIKLDHRFGAGVMIAGGAGVLGAAFDVNFNPFLSTSAYIGTGHEFTAIGFKAQYYILGSVVHPFIGLGYSNWFAGPGIQNINKINPKLIYLSLLNDEQRANAFRDGFSVHLIYPTFGVQFVHESQFSVAAEIMYLFDITDFQGSPYFGISNYYYF